MTVQGWDWDILLVIAVANISLSALHWALTKIKDKTSTDIDNKAHRIVEYLLTVLSWLMASRGCKK